MKIKDANLIDSITGTEKVPVSAGTDAPAAVSLDQIKEYVTEGVGSQSTPNGNASEGEDGYIENRTHYGEIVSEIRISDFSSVLVNINNLNENNEVISSTLYEDSDFRMPFSYSGTYDKFTLIAQDSTNYNYIPYCKITFDPINIADNFITTRDQEYNLNDNIVFIDDEGGKIVLKAVLLLSNLSNAEGDGGMCKIKLIVKENSNFKFNRLLFAKYVYEDERNNIKTLDEMYIPDTIARTSQLRNTPDGSANDDSNNSYIFNRTHYIRSSEYIAGCSMDEYIDGTFTVDLSKFINDYYNEFSYSVALEITPSFSKAAIINQVIPANTSYSELSGKTFSYDSPYGYDGQSCVITYNSDKTVTIECRNWGDGGGNQLNVVEYEPINEAFIPNTIARTSEIATLQETIASLTTRLEALENK